MQGNMGEPETAPLTRIDLERYIRGSIYLARLRVIRLEHAWPEPSEDQKHSIAQARRILAHCYRHARQEGVNYRSWRRK